MQNLPPLLLVLRLFLSLLLNPLPPPPPPLPYLLVLLPHFLLFLHNFLFLLHFLSHPPTLLSPPPINPSPSSSFSTFFFLFSSCYFSSSPFHHPYPPSPPYSSISDDVRINLLSLTPQKPPPSSITTQKYANMFHFKNDISLNYGPLPVTVRAGSDLNSTVYVSQTGPVPYHLSPTGMPNSITLLRST